MGCANWIGTDTPQTLILSVILHTLMRCVDKSRPLSRANEHPYSSSIKFSRAWWGIWDWSKCILLHQSYAQPETITYTNNMCDSEHLHTTHISLSVDPPRSWELLQSVLPSRPSGGVRRDAASMQTYKSALTERCLWSSDISVFIRSFLSLSIGPINPVSVRPTFIIQKKLQYLKWRTHTVGHQQKMCPAWITCFVLENKTKFILNRQMLMYISWGGGLLSDSAQ